MSPGTHQACEIFFHHTALANLLVKAGQGFQVLGQQEAPAGFTIQSMREFQKRQFRAKLVQHIQYAILQAATAMHGEAGGFVNYQAIVILEKNAACNSPGGMSAWPFDSRMRAGGIRTISPVFNR